MAEAAHLVLVPLVVISGLCAFILAVAWRAFGHVEHALTWACGFLLLALMWAMQWLVPAVQANPPAEALTSAIVGGAAVVLATVGFRQRAQLPLWAGRLSAFWLVQVAASLALARVASPIVLLTAPAHIQGLVMLVISSRTLRRRPRAGAAARTGRDRAADGGDGGGAVRDLADRRRSRRSDASARQHGSADRPAQPARAG